MRPTCQGERPLSVSLRKPPWTEEPVVLPQAQVSGPPPVRLTGPLVFQNQLSGNLLRKFKNSNGWQKLWVVFTNFCLFFYKSHQVCAPNPNPAQGRGPVPLGIERLVCRLGRALGTPNTTPSPVTGQAWRESSQVSEGGLQDATSMRPSLRWRLTSFAEGRPGCWLAGEGQRLS